MGFRIFMLCVMQLRNNWQTALKISWFWFLVITAGSAGLGSLSSSPSKEDAGLYLLVVLIVAGVSLFGGSVIAIGWHRFVLREEYPGNTFVFRPGWPVGVYVWNVVKIMFLCTLLVLPLMLALAIISGSPSGGLSVLFMAIIIIIGTWIVLRVGLFFPALAVGETIGFRESFVMTRPVSTPLLVTSALLVAVQSIPAILQLILGLPFSGQSTLLLMPINILFSWINLFLGVGVLTVLYGHLYENRPI